MLECWRNVHCERICILSLDGIVLDDGNIYVHQIPTSTHWFTFVNGLPQSIIEYFNYSRTHVKKIIFRNHVEKLTIKILSFTIVKTTLG